MSTMTAEARTAASTVDPTTAALIVQTDALRAAANAAGHGHDVQQPGRLYGDVHTALLNLLTVAYGPVDGPAVYDGMLDSGESAAYIAKHITAERAARRQSVRFAPSVTETVRPDVWDVLDAILDRFPGIDLFVADRNHGDVSSADAFSVACEGWDEWPRVFCDAQYEHRAIAPTVFVEPIASWCLGIYPA